MKMVKVVHVDIEPLPDPSCAPTRWDPQGRFPKVEIEVAVGSLYGGNETLIGKTCKCHQGHVTYGTWRIPPEGMVFPSIEALKHYLMKDDAYPVTHGGPIDPRRGFNM